MINERIRAGADAAKALDASIMEKAYLNAAKSPRPEENLRAVMLASLENDSTGTAKHTIDSVWRAALRSMYENDDALSEQTVMMLDALRDRDILAPKYESELIHWVKEDLLRASFRRPDLLEYVAKAWKTEFSSDLGVQLWAEAFRSYDAESARRLQQQVPAAGIPYLDAVDGKSEIAHAAVEVFAQSLTDDELNERIVLLQKWLDLDSTVKRGNVQPRAALLHLMLMTFEHVERFGVDEKLAKGFLERLDKHMEGYTEKMFASKAAELARLALSVGAAANKALAAIILKDGHQHVSGADLGALIAGGMPDNDGDGWRKTYLLNVVESSKQSPVAHAMSDKQRLDYMIHGIGTGVANVLAAKWQATKVESATKEDLLDVLHAADFGLGHQMRFNDADPPKWLHEWLFGGKNDAKRYAFVKLHLLGLLPTDLRYGGHGPMSYAAYYRDAAAIDALAKAGYDIEAKSAMHYADPMDDKKRNEEGFTALLIAAKYEREESVRRLIQLGADVGVKSGSGAGVGQLTKNEEIKRMLKSVKIGRTVDAAMKGDAAGGEEGPKARKSDIGLL